MELYFAGAEQPVYLRQLDDLGVEYIAISFYEWQRRHSVDDLYKHIPSHMKVIITPGVAKKETMDWDAFTTDYIEFAERNADHSLIYDLDAPHCPDDLRRHVRNRLDLLPNVVMFPMQGETITELADQYERIGINSNTAKSMINNELRRLQASLYGSNITDARRLRAGKFEATTSFVWLSGRRYGELWVWARNKMNHYPADRLAQSARSHKEDIEHLGVSWRAVTDNDPEALTAIAVRSCQAMAQALSKRPRDRKTVSIPATQANEGNGDSVVDGTTNPGALVLGNGAREVIQRERVVIPVIAVNDQANGRNVESAAASQRQCNSCYLADDCPKFQEDSACAFDFPVKIDTDSSLDSVLETIVEMQFGRIAFAKMAEEMEGGALQPRVGQEMDRLLKLLNQVKDLKTPAPAPGGGALAAAFGNLVAPSGEIESGESDNDGQEEGDQEDVYDGEIEDDEGSVERVDAGPAS